MSDFEENDDQLGGAKEKTRSKSKSGSKSAKSGSKTAKSGSKTAKSGSKTAKKTTSGSKTLKKKSSSKKLLSDEQDSVPGKRYFKLINPKTGESFGRYTGATPKQAASKGYTKILEKLQKDGAKIPKETLLYLRESTRNSNRKIYGYTASRTKLSEPQELNITDKLTGNPKKIVYNYRNKVRKVAVPEHLGGAAKSKSKSGSKTTKKPADSKSSKSKSSKSSKSKSNSKSKK